MKSLAFYHLPDFVPGGFITSFETFGVKSLTFQTLNLHRPNKLQRYQSQKSYLDLILYLRNDILNNQLEHILKNHNTRNANRILPQ